MRKAIITIAACCVANIAFCQANYDVSLISKDLLPYASAVVRDQQITEDVKAPDNTVYHIKQAITVLNKNGDEDARVLIWYNKSRSLRYFKGSTYNEFGKPVGKFTEKELMDVNAASDASLFEDSRVKHYLPATGSYPYTVEVEYEMRSKQSLNLAGWQPYPSYGVAVEKASYTFICDPDFKIRYKEVNMPVKAALGTTDGRKTYSWHLANVAAIRDEPYSPDEDTYLSMVRIAPVDFSYEGTKGSFTNWQELGGWIYTKLLNGRDELPQETVSRVKALTAGISDPKARAQKVYAYMQGKTRYISVQIGIGGYRPFAAAEVDNTSYGDCKALVNYTQALLKAADVPSWYCIVGSGSYKQSLQPDFASMSQADHVILCLPLKNDTTFLECTNQKIPFGFLGDFTDDRTVLACTPEGGKLLHTPRYDAAINLQQRKASFAINKDGTLTGDITTTFRGVQYDNVDEMVDEPASEQTKLVQKEYSAISNLDVQKFDLQQAKSKDPVSTEVVKLSARDFANDDNGRLYFALNPVNRMTRAPRDLRMRTTPVYINRGFTDEDEITYMLPDGYKVDKDLPNVSIEKPFGRFTVKTAVQDNKLIFQRKLQVLDGTYNKETYHDLVEFYQRAVDVDAYNVTLVKK